MTSNIPKSNRFSASHIWNAHCKGLRNRKYTGSDPSATLSAPDVFALTLLYGIPVGLGVTGYFLDATVAAIDGLLAAAGLLAGGLFMGFTQVATWRDRYTERAREREHSERPQRYSLDETVAHVLMATYGCLLLVVIILVGANFTNADDELISYAAAATIAVGAYVVLLMMIILPKLYVAYAVTHEVDDEMSGLHH